MTVSDADSVVSFYSTRRKDITRMRKHPAFTEVQSGMFEGTEWATFHVSADRWSPVGVKRSISLSSEQRKEAAARLKAVRGGS